MAGHSQFKNIMHRKGRQDAQKSKLFGKLAREITVAAKLGIPDPAMNPRLRAAIIDARAENMPKDNIERAIKKAAGNDGENYEEIRYEGYGPAGVAVIVDAATDNRNRTAAELRFLFSRHGGSLGETGSVGWIFDARGLLEVENGAFGEDALTEAALVDGVIDVRYDAEEGRSEIVTEPAELAAVREQLSAKGVKVTSMVLGFEPKQTVAPHGDEARSVLEFLEALDDHEDVQRSFSNAHLDAAELEALA